MKRLLLLFIILSVTFSLTSGQEKKVTGTDTLICQKKLGEIDTLTAADKYAEAFSNLLWLMKNCPSHSELIYISGQSILDTLIFYENNPKIRNILIDTMMYMYDQRIKYFGKEGFVLGRKGVKLYLLDRSRVQQAYNILDRSVKLEGYLSRPPVLVHYMNSAVDLVSMGKADTIVAYGAYEQVRKVYKEIRQFNPNEEYIYYKAYQSAGDLLNRISQCELFDKKFNDVYMKDSNNIVEMRRMVKFLQDRKCNNSTVINKIAKRVYEINPSPEASLEYANFLISMGNVNDSYKYFAAATKSTDTAIKVEAYILFGNIHRYYDALPRGRGMLLKALELDSTSGKAYYVLADLYYISVEECGQNPLDRAAAYWSVADKLELAEKADPGLHEKVAARLEECRKHYPDRNFLKENGLNPGDLYKLEHCWIMETVKVRAKD